MGSKERRMVRGFGRIQEGSRAQKNARGLAGTEECKADLDDCKKLVVSIEC